MSQTLKSENQFVIDLLTTLQAERFRPAAWWHFFVRSWQMSCDTAPAHPTLTRSWLRLTALIGLLTLGCLLVTMLTEGSSTMFRLLPGLLFCIVWQQSDLFWHLGLNKPSPPSTGIVFKTVGLANALTMMRGLCAGYLLARLVGGLMTPSGLALGVFIVGVITDILDGQVARRTGTQSKLGQIADGETDFCLYLALTLILIQNGALPLWVGLLMLLRFIVPLLAALLSYFWLAKPVRFGSTRWGKYAGLAQCLYFFVLLAPPMFASLTAYLNTPLLIVTVGLLIVAPIAQISNNLRS